MDAFMRFALNVREIVRKDPVLVVAIVLAIISPPSRPTLPMRNTSTFAPSACSSAS